MPPKPEKTPASRPTLLMVGTGDPLGASLKAALEQRGLDVGTVELAGAVEAIQLVAPDVVLLVGDAAGEAGPAALDRLSADAHTGAVPLILLGDESSADTRTEAFRHGALAIVARTETAQSIAARVARLTEELSEHFEERTGEVGEATFEKLVEIIKKGRRSGILSVHAPGHPGGPIRVVLGAGRNVAEAIEELVHRVKPHVPPGKAVFYLFHASAGGQVELLEKGAAQADPKILEGLRVLIVDDAATRANALAKELRDRQGIVFVTDTSGQGLERASGLDPQVAIVAARGLEGPGFEVVRAIRKDLRLRWASILVAPWEEIWPDGVAPDLQTLAAKVEPLLDAEREFFEKVSKGEPFDARLESMGPSRMLRILTQSSATHHLTITNPKAVIEVDVSQHLVVGATGRVTSGGTIEGTQALATLLALGSARVHVEQRANPAVANVMSPVEEALSAGSQDTPAISAVSAEMEAASSPAPLVPPPRGPLAPRPKGPLAPRPKRPFPSPKDNVPSALAPPPSAAADAIGVPSEGDEESDSSTSVKDLGVLAAVGEAFLDESSATVRPPAGVEVPSEAVRTPLPPAGGLAGRAPPKPPRKKTLLMGAPAPAQPALPSVIPTIPPEELEMVELSGPHASPSSAAPAAEAPLEEPTVEEPSAAPPTPPDAASAPAAGLFEEAEPPRATLGPDPEAAALVSPSPLPAHPRAPEAREPETEPAPKRAKGGAGRTFAKLVVGLAAVVLAVVLGLLGYRASGMRQPQLDGLLTALGAPPDSSPTTPDRSGAGASDVEAPIAENVPVPENVPEDVEAPENVENVEPENVEPENIETENVETENVETENVEPENVEPENVEPENVETNDVETNDVGELLVQARRAGSSDLAVGLYRRALELDPQEHHAMVDLAELLLERNEPAEAVSLLRTAVRRRPRRASYRVGLGDALAASGDRAAARQEWERALELEPDNRTARARLGQ